MWGCVHNRELGSNQGKFSITEVLEMWEELDGGVHCPGSYVMWNLSFVETKMDMSDKRRMKRDQGRNFRENLHNLVEDNKDLEGETEEDDSDQESEEETKQSKKAKGKALLKRNLTKKVTRKIKKKQKVSDKDQEKITRKEKISTQEKENIEKKKAK